MKTSQREVLSLVGAGDEAAASTIHRLLMIAQLDLDAITVSLNRFVQGANGRRHAATTSRRTVVQFVLTSPTLNNSGAP
jgi:hypothetical protein